jgi:hypothetical protein
MAGLDVKNGPPRQIDSNTLVVMWNRYNDNHALACQVEAAGGIVLVAENGYLGQGGSTPKFDVVGGVEDGHYYALAIGGHNGSGRWHWGGPERFDALNIDLKPLRTEGSHILVCPSRNFGRPDLIMPSSWLKQTVDALRKVSALPVVVREHPGNDRPKRTLAQDMEGAAAVVVWASSAGVHALVQGIPVLCGAPHWICKDATLEYTAAMPDLTKTSPWMAIGFENSRLQVMRRMAWAQWTVDEIASGVPFDHLLRHARQG